MPAFSIPLTGLAANSVALNTIGNNLANLNTTGYKKENANFADLYYENIGTTGSNSPVQVGFGTRVSSIDTDFVQGNIDPTNSATDMAINGNGFFVVQNRGVQQLTRTGNFSLDAGGNLITSDGQNVMGYPANGTSANTNSSLVLLKVPVGSTQTPHATSNFSITGGLDSSAAVGSTPFSRTQAMYDSLGQEHEVTMTFTKTAANQWNYSFSLPSGENATSANTTGTLTFNTDGTLASPSSNISGISFGGMTDGSADIALTWQLRDSAGKGLITQGASTSSVNASTQDGYAAGNYTGFSVDANGVLSAKYSNNQTEVVGEIALATVANPSGLTRNGENTYVASSASGLVTIGAANTGGRGQIVGSALEGSNVDISTEFADLIVAQRSFEANSKTVTAFDTITQDTISMLR
ncbi:flagellar hook protein FlgE [Terriglobus sp.]|uniref:flagellar hook protein FlgE n=1 Tax=Terriglobus sp. TaxID=1889013 RepID=UPI003B00B386